MIMVGLTNACHPELVSGSSLGSGMLIISLIIVKDVTNMDSPVKPSSDNM